MGAVCPLIMNVTTEVNVMMKKLVASLAIAAATSISVNAIADIDPKLPSYSKASGVSGNISSVGSDTLANLMTLWAEDFKRLYPNVNIQIQAAGSSTMVNWTESCSFTITMQIAGN